MPTFPPDATTQPFASPKPVEVVVLPQKQAKEVPAPQDETKRPIEMVAKELGAPYWLTRPASTEGSAVDGPGWLLAGVMAGNKLESGTPITRAELERLGQEAQGHTFGYSAHPVKKEG